MADQWLSIVEYARAYNLSDMTVRRRIKTGKLHAVLQEGKYYIPLTPSGSARGLPQPENTKRYDEGSASSAPPTHSARPFNEASSSNANIVIKNHPTPSRIFPDGPSRSPLFDRSRLPTEEAEVIRSGISHNDDPANAEPNPIPTRLRQSLIKYETSLIDSQALISYCETSLRNIHESERKTAERLTHKIEALEAMVALRDQEIKGLKQQLEDLQLLVKILERRKGSN